MRKIVLVEDNEINAKLIRDFLKFKGYDVIIVTSGLDAKEIVLKELPKLILMDIQLFGMSGIEAAKSIKEDPILKNIPIIAVSAFSKEKLEEKDLSEFFIDYVEKPIDFQSFGLKIEKFMV
ncbi:cell division response regulator DivK [endosymbiont of Acanthamoeba sp. UWC8]|uniref:Cell division response regulator DivK n=1 Tax=Candidatus Jidaibacter acanthamoebae TaxID=86105 RepID=A0A0C1R017_9RICK|nr:response regulator [Candidatus Jidaibacter acanthamoeba]AIF81089.1 cell division response regulator DivK [endosymbiont of Acanthamoeba sp. UWC8]KIE05640.1 Cell division response regulator DivK [Candidatus Jidaibacter acanthamoeba]